MHFDKLSVVFLFLALVGGMRCAKILTSKPTGYAEIEEAAINILTNCHANRDKTIVLSGSFPGSFVEKLSSRRCFSLASLDDRKRPMNNPDFTEGSHRNRWRKIHIVAMLATNYERYDDMLLSLMSSPYYNTMAFFLIIAWSPEKRYAACEGGDETLWLLANLYVNEILKVNLLCEHRQKGITLFTFDPFGNRAPKPWRYVEDTRAPRGPNFYWFDRKYRENEDMCKNLDFEKTRDVGGAIIETLRPCRKPYCYYIPDKYQKKTRRTWILEKKRSSYIDAFIAYVNATGVDEFVEVAAGKWFERSRKALETRPSIVRMSMRRSFAYPHGYACMYLVTQFRGNKTQLRKILAVIDGYSWIGTAVVCLVTLVFFKYFLRQTLTDGMLNVMRLSCNMGLTTVPRNVPSRIYMACLLSFVVTMQGIFVSNLAALLTQDIPVRQVDAVQDLADLGYTIYTHKSFFMLFKGIVPEDRIVTVTQDDNCLKYVLRDPANACLESDGFTRDMAHVHNLHLSDCVQMEHVTNGIPDHWALEEIFNKFLGIVTAGGIMMPLYYIVDERRLLEAEAQVGDPEPRAMTLNDLGFAFVILGIGLTCALVTFVIELMIHRYRRRVRTTRVVLLK